MKTKWIVTIAISFLFAVQSAHAGMFDSVIQQGVQGAINGQTQKVVPRQKQQSQPAEGQTGQQNDNSDINVDEDPKEDIIRGQAAEKAGDLKMAMKYYLAALDEYAGWAARRPTQKEIEDREECVDGIKRVRPGLIKAGDKAAQEEDLKKAEEYYEIVLDSYSSIKLGDSDDKEIAEIDSKIGKLREAAQNASQGICTDEEAYRRKHGSYPKVSAKRLREIIRLGEAAEKEGKFKKAQCQYMTANAIHASSMPMNRQELASHRELSKELNQRLDRVGKKLMRSEYGK